MAGAYETDREVRPNATVIIGARHGVFARKAEEAVERAGLRRVRARDLKGFLSALGRTGLVLGVVELDFLEGRCGEIRTALDPAFPPIRLLVVASGPREIERANIQTGGCITHLFAHLPCESHLSDFIAGMYRRSLRYAEAVGHSPAEHGNRRTRTAGASGIPANRSTSEGWNDGM